MKKSSIAATSVIIAMAMGMVSMAHAGNKNWTGLYAGVDAGFVFNYIQLTSQQLGFTSPSETCNATSNFGSFSPGIQLGYLYQFANAVVTGVEVNTSFNTNQTNTSSCNSDFNSDVYDSFTFKNQLQTSLKARVGRALNWNKNTFLPYLTAGASFANLGLTYKNEGGDFYSNATTKAGWLVGAGIEWAFLQHWSVRAEYNYVDYGNAINLNIPTVYGLLDTNGGAQVNLKSSSVAVAVNYWF